MKKSLEPNACRKRQAIISKHHTRAIVHMLVAGLIAGAAIAPSNALAQAEPKVLGKTIGEWSVKWWQWAFAIPASTNPMLHDDTDPIPYDNFCHLGQQGPVWFLAGVWDGGTATRSCTVPRGKHILFSIANTFWIQTETDPADYTETDYRREASDYLLLVFGDKPLVATLENVATRDKKPIIFDPNTPIIRSQSPVFTASFPPDNVFNAPPSFLTGPIVSDGFWVMLPPLSPGKYELHFEAGDANATKNKGQNVTYILTVR
jgi:hypothetical protein